MDGQPGILETRVGYTGGKKLTNVHYRNIQDHTEAIQIDFDPSVVSYDDLLAKWWKAINPHGSSRSCQYKSAVWYHNDDQKKKIEASIAAIEKASGRKVTVEHMKASEFFLAEEYHQHYVAKQRGRR